MTAVPLSLCLRPPQRHRTASVWSSNRARHRLSRTGNRQLNAALHRTAMTQARCRPPARELIARRKASGDGGLEALRVLKRRLTDAIYHALRTDVTTRQPASG